MKTEITTEVIAELRDTVNAYEDCEYVWTERANITALLDALEADRRKLAVILERGGYNEYLKNNKEAHTYEPCGFFQHQDRLVKERPRYKFKDMGFTCSCGQRHTVYGYDDGRVGMTKE